MADQYLFLFRDCNEELFQAYYEIKDLEKCLDSLQQKIDELQKLHDENVEKYGNVNELFWGRIEKGYELADKYLDVVEEKTNYDTLCISVSDEPVLENETGYFSIFSLN